MTGVISADTSPIGGVTPEGPDGATVLLRDVQGSGVPESVNAIFGRNLRTLCEERGSYADAARTLGINRIQLSRFFKGESFPKPNQLARICALFGVDSRIFTTPLEELRAAADLASAAVIDQMREKLPRYHVSEAALPSGIHLLYRPAILDKSIMAAAPILVRRSAGQVLFRGIAPVSMGLNRRMMGPFSNRSFAGAALAVPGGVSIFLIGTGMFQYMMSGTYLVNGDRSQSFMRGSMSTTRPLDKSLPTREPSAIEILPQTCGTILRRLRENGAMPPDALPDGIREHFLGFAD